MVLSRTRMAMLACGAALWLSLPAMAALNSSDVVNAIKKAQFLDESIQLNARIDGDQILVSTFRNPHYTEGDLKIDAIMIAQAVLDVSPSAARITTYFYGTDLSQYQEVSVTAGDVKAFISGGVGKDQLLAGIKVETKKHESNSDKIANQLQSSYFARPDFKVSMQQGSVVEITTPTASWVSDEECKLNALTLAFNSMNALPEGTRQLKIVMVDPSGKSETRSFTFNTPEVTDMWRSVQSTLGSLVVAKQAPTIDVQSLKVVEGPGKAEREKLLARLKELHKEGVGVAPFVQAFLTIEKNAKAGDEANVIESVKRLEANLVDQEKAMALAKQKRQATPKAPVATNNAAPAGRRSRWAATGDQPIIENEVLQNPASVISKLANSLGQGFRSPDENPKFLIALDQISSILRQHNRAADAAVYEQRAAAMRSKGIR